MSSITCETKGVASTSPRHASDTDIDFQFRLDLTWPDAEPHIIKMAWSMSCVRRAKHGCGNTASH